MQHTVTKGKILFLINGLGGGGAEKSLVLLANHFVTAGHEVVIVTIEFANCAYPLDSRVQVHNLLPFGRSGALRNVALPLQAIALAWQVFRTRPAVVVSFLQRANFVNILSTLLVRHCPRLVSEHSLPQQIFSSKSLHDRMTLKLIAVLYPLSDAVLCVSQGVASGLQDLGVHGNHPIVYNPVNIVSAKREHPTLTLISVGRLISEKDHATLIHAVAPLLQEFDAELLIVGTGPLESDLRRLSGQLGVAAKIRFLGWTPDVSVPLSRSDIFVLSSRFEGFGNVLVEAMACGVPVVSTDCPSGPAEILEGGRYGKLVPVGDQVALRRELRLFMTDAKLRDHYSNLALRRAKDFEVNKVADLYYRCMFPQGCNNVP